MVFQAGDREDPAVRHEAGSCASAFQQHSECPAGAGVLLAFWLGPSRPVLNALYFGRTVKRTSPPPEEWR